MGTRRRRPRGPAGPAGRDRHWHRAGRRAAGGRRVADRGRRARAVERDGTDRDRAAAAARDGVLPGQPVPAADSWSSRVLAQVPEGPMTDLYAGAGLFGLAHAGARARRRHRGRRRPRQHRGPCRPTRRRTRPRARRGAVGRRGAPASSHGRRSDHRRRSPTNRVVARGRSRPWPPPARRAWCTCRATSRRWRATPPRLPPRATIW